MEIPGARGLLLPSKLQLGKMDVGARAGREMVNALVWLLRRGSVLLRKSREVGLLYVTQLVLRRLVPDFVLGINKLAVNARVIRSLEEYQTSDLEFRWAGPEDIEKMVATGEPVASTRNRFDEGARLAVVERGGRIMAYCWWQEGDFDYHAWLRFNLSPTDVWNIYTWVAPELRGRGMYARVTNFACVELARVGNKRILGVADALHRNSIRAAAKIDMRPIGYIWFVRILGFTLVRFDRSVRVGWWGLGRRLDLPMLGFGKE